MAGPFTTQGPRFDESGVMLEAAAAGLGVALAREVFVQGDLDAGRLVRLFDVSIPAWPRCYLAWREGSAKKVLVNRLRAWIWEETAGWRRG
uniref:LysR substrate-binding domain-containing protein n=1 Tax=Phenylobacterium glaciei TaxID=2803784 RepID=A0A974P2S3_9CAUL|nr:hypothetical protein JKL49_20180 [Phenylobacterium glaciei]